MLVFLSVAMLRAVLVDPAADVLHASEVLEPSDLGGRRKALQHAAPGVLEMVPRPERRFRGLDLADGACQLLLDIEPQSQRGIPVWLLRLELFELLLPGPGDPLAVRLPLPPPSGAGGAEGVQPAHGLVPGAERHRPGGPPRAHPEAGSGAAAGQHRGEAPLAGHLPVHEHPRLGVRRAHLGHAHLRHREHLGDARGPPDARGSLPRCARDL
mmetsp:Transcript_16387/g.38901  ORF Transcript_16387/g.38901 Transcript_16387/m.38901 type:complete len:212 (-) Transcript_16387:754-1389(-)